MSNDLLNSGSLAFVEALYARYLADPKSVDGKWRAYFEEMPQPERNGRTKFQPSFSRRSVFNPLGGPPERSVDRSAGLQERLDQLVRNYRVRGHIVAGVDPLGHEHPQPAELDPAFYGFTEDDFARPFSTSFFGGPEVRTLREMIKWLRTTYCRSIGVQFMHIDSLQVRSWLAMRMESTGNRLKLDEDHQRRILRRLADAVVFEEFVQKKYIGAKSFSLEGAETLVPLLDMLIEKAGSQEIDEIVMGMAHRGRLNVLANIMHKSPRLIFREFEDRDAEHLIGRGDVKYHLGYSSDWQTADDRNVHLSLCFNPSHLEFVNTVALGRLRAKQDRYKDFDRRRGMCVLIHGDAAFAGEGIVQETLNLSELPAYRVGGTIHVVVNNQIGFTTVANEGRSTTYATDVARMLQIPIFHVNGEDPEAVAQVVSLAMDFRERYQRDVVIDMYCYRRRGHNEGDEPSFTQPVMYRKIGARPSVFEGYLERLKEIRGISQSEGEHILADRHAHLETELEVARGDEDLRRDDTLLGVWRGYRGGPFDTADNVQTGVPANRLSRVLEALSAVPEGFRVHPKLDRLLGLRRHMAAGKRALDWGGAEALAFGTLVADGHPFRMTGQDVCRGTFSHRHAVLYDNEDGHPHVPLKSLAGPNTLVEIANSPLSEAGVLGFEYGYSLDDPEGLVVWEAQFGDFANAAQVVIDQFIASAEDKWDRLSALVMLLPHGFEGQGPEHSSARLERFLALAADDNMQIAQPSTPAQLFHLLRRQVLRKWKKPLVVMTPKSLLRLKACVSPLEELASGEFLSVIPDRETDASRVRRILLCSGKVYYDLIETRERLERDDVAIVRLEEYYPVPTAALEQALRDYADGTPVVWVQDEPRNMGAARFFSFHFGTTVFERFPFGCVTREASASPATGSKKSHEMEQERLHREAFAED